VKTRYILFHHFSYFLPLKPYVVVASGSKKLKSKTGEGFFLKTWMFCPKKTKIQQVSW